MCPASAQVIAMTPSPPVHTRPVWNTQLNPYAPKFYNVSQNSNIYQRVVLIHGSAGPPNTTFDASMTVYHHLSEFPPQFYPVSDGYFKALVQLSPGQNDLKFVFHPGSLGGATLTTDLKLVYTPLLQNAPLHLAILLARDSECKFDSPTIKKNQEGNGLDTAVRKMRMAGYLWQAFTGEQMSRAGMGRRTFRLHEEWGLDTLSKNDSTCRTTAKVHIIRSKKTIAEIRDIDVAQQNHNGKRRGDLFGIAVDAIRDHGGIFAETPNNDETHVAVLFMDTQWDNNMKLIRGHAALGGGSGNVKLGIFGSHAIYSWPTCFEEVVPCFMDATKADIREVANDAGEPGLNFQAANVGIGAFLHEVGHLLGCPHQPSGIMLQGYTTFHRSFVTREVRISGESLRIVLPKDECGWHRLDLLRFRCHPMFRLPPEPIVPKMKPALYPVENGAIAISHTGIYLIEVHCDGGCRAHLEYPEGPQKEVFLFEDELRSLMPAKYRAINKPMKLEILVLGQQQLTVEDFSDMVKKARFEIGRRPVFSSIISNPDTSNGAQNIQVLFRKVKRIRIYHGSAVDGMEFFFDSGSAMFGNRGGSPSDFNMETSESIVGIHVRAGAWVDAIQIITNLKRSAVYGNALGGSPCDLIPPLGYYMIGIHGTVDHWLTRIGIIYSGEMLEA
ncbi:putative peptidase family-domain-containing protein [Lipomyces starkeyi]